MGRLTHSLARFAGVAAAIALTFQIWCGSAYWSRLGLFVQRCLKREMIKAAPPGPLAEQLEAETSANQ